jgi:hypothetical protein
MTDNEPEPKHNEEIIERSLTTSLITDATIVAAPTAAVIANHLLNTLKAPPPPPQQPATTTSERSRAAPRAMPFNPSVKGRRT